LLVCKYVCVSYVTSIVGGATKSLTIDMGESAITPHATFNQGCASHILLQFGGRLRD